MTPVRAPVLAAKAFALSLPEVVDVNYHDCIACGAPLEGKGVPYKPNKSFGDSFLLASPTSQASCANCAGLMASTDATRGTGSGVATKDGFQRLLSNIERLRFLMDPPKPPFAVAMITAQRQHAWWMARTSYDRDLILMQFGHRPLTIDRPLAIKAAQAVLDYEAEAAERLGKPTYVFAPLSRELKSPNDGDMTFRFQSDESDQAKAVRHLVNKLSLGDLWAMMQIRAAVRAAKVSTPEEALEFYAAAEAK